MFDESNATWDRGGGKEIDSSALGDPFLIGMLSIRKLHTGPWPRRRLVWLALVPAALFGFGAYGAGRHLWAVYHYRAAEHAIARGEFAPALERLQQCLTVWPGSGQVRLLAARTARRAGLFDEAGRQLKACRELGWVPEEIDLEQGLLHVQQGRVTGLHRYLLDCVNRGHPDSLLILEALSKGLWKTYRFSHALQCLHLWVERDPDNRRALYLRAQVAERLGRHAEVIADCRRVLELDPDHDAARLQLAEVLDKTRQPDEAVGHFQFLCRRRPARIEARLGLARCLRARGESGEARAVLEALLAEYPDDAAVLRQRGKLALQTEQAGEAEHWLREALRRDPGEREALYDLYLCLQQQGKNEEAKETLARLERVTADVRRLAELTKEVARGSRDPALRCEAGMIFLKNGQDKEGLRWLASALQEDPAHRPTCQALADYYARQGDAEAAERYRRLAQQPPAGGLETLADRHP